MPFGLADAIFWVAVACCCVAQLLIIRSVATAPDPSRADHPSRGRRATEIAFAVIPGVALAIVLLFTWRAMHGPAASGVQTNAAVADQRPT